MTALQIQRKAMPNRVKMLAPGVLLLLAACGNDESGNEDTLLTGFSGVVILAIIIWLVVRMARKRR